MKPLVVLFVEPDSVYKRMGLDCYDEARDARTYCGTDPVVAHPPCQLWGSMAAVNFARWGGEHNRPGNDEGLFRFALDTVRRCGGVLEHPAKTRAWAAHGLTAPKGLGWQSCGDDWVCEVWQSAYGHRANKATWLYLVGEPMPLRWERPTGTHQVGFHDQRGKLRNKPTLGRREANATPPKFADALVELARRCSTHNKAMAKNLTQVATLLADRAECLLGKYSIRKLEKEAINPVPVRDFPAYWADLREYLFTIETGLGRIMSALDSAEL